MVTSVFAVGVAGALSDPAPEQEYSNLSAHSEGIDGNERENPSRINNTTVSSESADTTAAETVIVTDPVLNWGITRQYTQTVEVYFFDPYNQGEYHAIEDDEVEDLDDNDPRYYFNIPNEAFVDPTRDFDEIGVRFDAYHAWRADGDLYPIFGDDTSDVQGFDEVWWADRLEKDDASTSYESYYLTVDERHPKETVYFEEWIGNGHGILHFYQTEPGPGWRTKNVELRVPKADTGADWRDNVGITTSEDDVSISTDDLEYVEEATIRFDYELLDGNNYLEVTLGDERHNGYTIVSMFDDIDEQGHIEKTVDGYWFEEEDSVQITFDPDGTAGASSDGGKYEIENVEVEWVLETADFEVEIVDTNDPVEAGDILGVTAEITNPGPADDSEFVELGIGSLGTDSTTVSLDGGESTTETFSVQTGSADSGSYTATVAADGDDDSQSVTVREPANFAIDIVDTNTPVEEGDDFEVTAEVTNTGEVSDTQTTEVNVDGVGSDSESTTLGGGDSTTTTFTISTFDGDAGTYTAAASSEDDSDSTSVAVLEPASFDVEIIDTTSPVEEGEDLEIFTRIENAGDVGDTQAVELDLGSLGTDSSSITLDGDTSTQETFSVSTEDGDVGTYDANVETEDDADVTAVEVLADDDDPYFSVEAVDANEPVVEGDDLEFDLEVKNHGDLEDTQSVSVTVDGLGMDTTEVWLDGDAATTAQLTIPTGEGDAGTYDTSVETEDESEELSVVVDSEIDEAFTVVTIDSTNDPIVEGDDLEVTTTIENTGDESTSQQVELEIEGLGSDSTTVNLDAGDSTQETFTISTVDSDAGEYTATVTTEDDEHSTLITVQETGSDDAFFTVDVDHEPDVVAVGESAEFTLAVENIGESSGTQTLESTIYLDGEELDSADETFSLDGGESVTDEVSTEYTDDDVGDWMLDVCSENECDSTSWSVVEDPDDPLFEVQIVETNAPVLEGEPLLVEATVTNTGESGETFIDLHVDGSDDFVDFEEVALDSGETTSVELEYNTEPGDGPEIDVEVVPLEHGISDETTVTVETDRSSLSEYTDDDGIVQTDGLRDAIDDWRSDEIDTDLLRDVIDAWRSGDPVE